ncbi:MAG: winged helix-turn-helix transcriptional regulator [Thermoplasmata archaeon]|nr:winged helix-turn-helix transcriptional regulator [Thermoplasmata archaeon]
MLYLVQKDARISYKEIAKILNRSETTIRDRIKSMEEAGIIQGSRHNTRLYCPDR